MEGRGTPTTQNQARKLDFGVVVVVDSEVGRDSTTHKIEHESSILWVVVAVPPRAGTLGFAKPSTCVLDLANARVEGVGLQRAMAGTLGFAKPSTWVLDLANARVEGGGLAKNDGRFGKCEGGESAGGRHQESGHFLILPYFIF